MRRGEGVKPDECAYVGDSVADVVAANAAGMLAIAVPSGNRPASQYKEAGAAAVVRSLDEVLPALLTIQSY